MIPIAIEEKVKNLKDIDSIFELFEFLEYKKHLFDKSYKRNKTDFNLPKDILPNIENVYSVFNIEKHLFCFAIETKNISRPFLKAVSKSLLDSYIRVLLIFTDDWETYYFTLPQYEKYEGKKRLKLSSLIVDTKQIYRTDLEVISTLNITQEKTYRDIWRNCWQQAFNKERVNDEFFEDFEKVFFELRSLVFNQIKDVKLAHEFAQQTLNRLIFLYFIAKKGWLASDKKFISNFYKGYKVERNKSNVPKDSFYENWLKILFFEVFNKSFPSLGFARYIPADLKNNLIMFPYLNGGLFNEEDFDKVGVNIPDSTFNKIFVFLDKYNFTIKEDSPLDVEVAVDPQMLGYLYESFANIAEEIYERNDLGVFYTPVSEVGFMVRRSLVEYFANHLQKIPKDLIYKFVFDEDKKEAIEYISKYNLWEDLEFLTEDVKIVDPACGSGAFLLGCLKVLVELTQITNRHLGRERKDFDIKKDIIGKNFFGVDVMKWALHCAELRLWLSMIVEADLPEERRKEPLLPNFNLRLRVGDSLVQKIGDINLNLESINISGEVKRKLNYLKQEKQKFYSNAPSRKFKDCESIKNEETRIFREILKEEIINKNKEIQASNNQLYKIDQLNIFGETSKDKIDKKNLKNEVELLEEKRKLLEKVCEELKSKEKQFVIWEIDFADIFENDDRDKRGFDIVIGNPPYINYKKIYPPFASKNEFNLKDKTIKYKEELVRSIKIKYPFVKEFDRKCDYYIYFYLHGLSLLNSKGTFCFITSNSWLDVDYGRTLQELLIKYVPIKAIYDNQVKRSFAHALINTVIVFFGAPLIKNNKNPNPTCLDNVAKFVMLKKPYEEVISTQNLIAIDNFITDTQSLFGNTLKTDQFRVYAIKQRDLLGEGIEIKQNKNEIFDNKLFDKYVGSKWGGKYLRAPDIFFRVMKKGRDKIKVLKDLANIYTGIKIAGYGSYIFNRKKLKNLGVKDFSKYIPILKEVKSARKIIITENDSYIVKKIRGMANKLKKERANILWPSMKGDRYICYKNKYLLPYTGNFFGLNSKNKEDDILLAILNSTLTIFFAEIFGRRVFGGGSTILVKSDLEKLPILDSNALNLKEKQSVKFYFNKILTREIKSIFIEIGISPDKLIYEQQPNPLPDRKALDDVVFDALGLTQEERREVYWATAELIKNRSDKARSVKKK
jgi:hypothetical protein